MDSRVHRFPDVSMFNLPDAPILHWFEDAGYEPKDHEDDCD